MTIQALRNLQRRIFWSAGLFTLLYALTGAATLQAQSVTDGSTPLALQPGAPAGSYRLSDFENINFFSGSLNFSLPLVDIHGRGEAAYTMSVPIERHWRVDTDNSNGSPLYTAYSGDWTNVVLSFG